MTHRLEAFDPRTASESVLRGTHAVITAIELEDVPAGPATSFEQLVMRLSATPPPHLAQTSTVALEGEVVVGYSMCRTWPEEDPDNAFLEIMVHPDRRRRGIGTSLLTEAVEKVSSEGRGKLIIDCPDGRRYEAKLGSLGLKSSLAVRRSRLHTEDIDRGLMARWVERARERAAEYEVVFMDFPVPDELLDNWARVKSAINDEPTDDLEFERVPMTAERWRAHETYVRERGERALACAARHIPSGEFAGTTVIYLLDHMADYAIQGDTAVLPAHRDLGLGRMVKGAMAKRILADFPDVRIIDTQNAGSNDAMLGINVEMGFKPIARINAWQGETATVLSRLRGPHVQ